MNQREGVSVADKKRTVVQIRCTPEWAARVERFAERAGLSVSGFLRLAANKVMQSMDDELPPGPEPEDGKGRKRKGK